MISVEHMQELIDRFNSGELDIRDIIEQSYFGGRADAIDEFDRLCEEARNHKFGLCDANFVIDVIKAKVKEQLKEQGND